MAADILTFGYCGRTFPNFAERVLAMNAIVMDIRLLAFSHAPEWRLESLEAAFGNQYVHNPKWGLSQKNYRTIEISDWQAGLCIFQRIQEENPDRPIILMCRCRGLAGCHRGQVAKRLKDIGYSVKEMEWRT